MTSRQPPSHRDMEGKRQQRWLQSTFPGAWQGRVANAWPVPISPGTVEASEDSGSGGGASDTSMDAVAFHNEDIFDITVDGAQDLDLTYLPIPGSVHCELNGIKGRRGVDWEVEDATVTCLAPWDVREDDVVTVEYAYLEGMPAVPTGLWADEVAASGPLAWYRLGDVSNGGTMSDSSGNAHHGAWRTSTAHSLTDSLVLNDEDGALLMTGTSSEGGAVTSGSWMNITTNLSWLLIFQTTDSAARLFAREQSAGGGQDWSLQLATGQVHFIAAGSVVASSIDTTLADGNLHMAVFTYDGSDIRIYIDGAIDKTQAYSTPLGTTAYDITIGYGGGTTTSHMFSGTLDEAIIWDRVLTVSEISTFWEVAT